MNVVAITVTLVCCLMMFLVKREQKVALLVFGMLTLVEVRVPFLPYHKANHVLPLFFLLSEWNRLGYYARVVWRQLSLSRLSLLVIFSTLLCAVTTNYSDFRSVVESELLFKYFALIYAYCATKNERTLKPVLVVSLCCLVIMTAFGILNLVEGRAQFVNAVTEGRTSNLVEGVALGDVGMYDDRFRVRSMFRSPFDYGYLCAAMLLLHLHGLFRRMESWWVFCIVLACCLFGILTCNCRIVWICSFLSVSSYYLWCFKPDRILLTGIVVIIASVVIYTSVPKVQEKVDQLTDIFSEHPEVKGSSMEMRMVQLATTWAYVEGHELLGLGIGYFGFLSAGFSTSVYGLWCLESVVYSYLLERGVVGLVVWTVFYIWLFSVFWRNRKRKKYVTGLGASILMLYLFFAIGTGELGSVYPTLLLQGMVMKFIYCK